MSKTNAFAEELAVNIPSGEIYRSKSGVPLFFVGSTSSDMFASLFSINERIKFKEAFRVATGGVGNEFAKINSVASSALLPLLVFHPLFVNSEQDNRLSIKIGQKFYNRVFFEIRNKVVRRPSCIDIVLQSDDGKTLLFLESKLTEYIDGIKDKAIYGKGYWKLYSDTRIKEALKKGGFKEPLLTANGVLLSAPEGVYIEGIKQSLSHLIGIVKGPMDIKEDDNYPSDYLEQYRKVYSDAEEFIYGTIIYDPTAIGIGKEEFKAYINTYKNIFSNAPEILASISEYCGTKNKPLTILETPITYQEIFSNNETFFDNLHKVKAFYRFQ